MLIPCRIQLFSFAFGDKSSRNRGNEIDKKIGKRIVDFDFALLYLSFFGRQSAEKIVIFMMEDGCTRACQKPAERRRFEKDRCSYFLFPSLPRLRGGGGGGEFPSSPAKVTTWPSPTFSAVNILRESGGSDNYRPMNSDGHPLSLKGKPNRMATGLAAKLSKMAKAENPQNPRKKQRAPRIFLFTIEILNYKSTSSYET